MFGKSQRSGILKLNCVTCLTLLLVPSVHTDSSLNKEFAFEVTISPEVKSCHGPVINRIIEYTEVSENLTYARGDKVEVWCEDGYRFPHIKSRVVQVECQLDGSWVDVLTHQQLPSCERIGSCPIPHIDYGEVLSKFGGYMPLDIAPVRCDVSSSYHIICQKDGAWRTTTGAKYINNCAVVMKNCTLPPDAEHRTYKLFKVKEVSSGIVPERTEAMFFCADGYTFSSRHMLMMTCINGVWEGIEPKCVPKKNNSVCLKPATVPNAHYSLYGSTHLRQDGTFPEGTNIMYFCENGYKLYGASRRLCLESKWTGEAPTCIPGCSAPPTVAHADYNFFGQRTNKDGKDDLSRISEGSSVYYFCGNGYRMMRKSMSALKCVEGQWQGTLPVCEKRTKCDTPMDIPHGNWIMLSIYADFRIGSRVSYECDEGFKTIGVPEIECLDTGYWSDYAPRCLPADQYCQEPKSIEHGFYMCIPNHCNMFSIGTEVHYLCSKNYTPESGSINKQTCNEGGNWSKSNPVCVKESDVMTTDSSLELTSSTMTVVIVTSCTLLGLLLVVMLVVIIQRRNNPRRHHYDYVQHVQGNQLHHPPYERVHEARVVPTIDEHDRVALIAFADGVQVVLPSYEEAITGCRTQQSGRLHRYNSDSSRGSGRSGSARVDYRPLPTLQYNIRQASYLRELPNDQRDHHRNSIITTASSAIRGGDNLSLTFGSMDTMNISDNTSTTVTLGTYDSGASNPSLALSQRGVTGSLASSNSNPSLVTEEAPLIEQVEPLVIHRSQTASPSIPEETEEEQIQEIPHK